MRKNDSIFGVILVCIGGYYLLRNFGILSISIGKLWPVALIALGGYILLKSGKR